MISSIRIIFPSCLTLVTSGTSYENCRCRQKTDLKPLVVRARLSSNGKKPRTLFGMLCTIINVSVDLLFFSPIVKVTLACQESRKTSSFYFCCTASLALSLSSDHYLDSGIIFRHLRLETIIVLLLATNEPIASIALH